MLMPLYHHAAELPHSLLLLIRLARSGAKGQFEGIIRDTWSYLRGRQTRRTIYCIEVDRLQTTKQVMPAKIALS